MSKCNLNNFSVLSPQYPTTPAAGARLGSTETLERASQRLSEPFARRQYWIDSSNDEEGEEAKGESDNGDGEDQRYVFVVVRDHP